MTLTSGRICARGEGPWRRRLGIYSDNCTQLSDIARISVRGEGAWRLTYFSLLSVVLGNWLHTSSPSPPLRKTFFSSHLSAQTHTQHTQHTHTHTTHSTQHTQHTHFICLSYCSPVGPRTV